MDLPTDERARKLSALKALAGHWGYASFRDGQWEAVDLALTGRDALIIFPTGGGKSLCYQLPALLRPGVTLVISPLIALMQDQVAGLNARRIDATFINSTLSTKEIDRRWNDVEHGRYKLVYVAPERLESAIFQARAERMNIDLVAVDEAHCISEWGHHFRPSYLRIADACEKFGDPPIIAVTATATPEVRRDIVTHLRLRDPVLMVKGFDRPNITWSVFQTDNKAAKLLEIVRSVGGSGLVYAGSRRGSEEWARRLDKAGVSAEAYHAGKTGRERAEIAERWMAGKTAVVAATNAFGMGIDKPDVRFVIHIDLPLSLESYYQEAGRAGRDGKRSHAVLLYQSSDSRLPESLIEDSHPERSLIQKVYATASSMNGIALGSLPAEPVTIDSERIASTLKCSASAVNAAVEQLERQGIWQPVQSGGGSGFVRISGSAADLRAYASSLKNRSLAAFVEAFMRQVPAEAYSDWARIDLSRMARNLGISQARLGDGLAFLEKQSVLSYNPPGAARRVAFLHPRTKHVPVDDTAIRRAKKRAKARFRHILRYAHSGTCRRRQLLGYYGEYIRPPCGSCDVCLGRHERIAVTSRDENALVSLLNEIERGTTESPGGSIESQERRATLVSWLLQEGYLDYPDLLEGSPELTHKARQWLEQRKRHD